MHRYETSPRGTGIDEGLAMRLHDPLWLIGRQWQFGEFTHENVASPAWVEVDLEVHPVDQWRPADAEQWTGYDVRATPLERLVEEHEGGPSPRLALEGGLRLRRALTAAGRGDDLAAFVARCPFPHAELADPLDARVRAELPDGRALVRCLTALATTADRADEVAALEALGPVESAPAQLGALAENWLQWWTTRAPAAIPADQDAWDETRFEHRFALRSQALDGLELHATEYAGGRLDWSALDAVGRADPVAGAVLHHQVAIPAPARFGGMPAPRLWEMEDARFDPGSIDAAPIDLGRLMLVSFATVYGNDWFVLPVRLPVASLSRVVRFTVHTTFDEPVELTQLGRDQDGWNLFALTDAGQPLEPDQERPTSPWFFLPPTLPASLESAPVDVVSLMRDEMANVAWAVESLVRDDAGRRLDRFSRWAIRRAEALEAAEAGAGGAALAASDPLYRVTTEVPDHWFPLLPEQLADLESVRLRLVPFTRLVDGAPSNDRPVGTLLPPVGSVVHEEEVPRSGTRVVRTWQHSRWYDGTRHVWAARRRLTGTGEGDSGLRFDQLETEQ
ncbi:hypothetical protein [Knoellia aerolata]|uniref:Uncharacterized protein n=1 Tax=Knoellia aerolata DSM 18566 TaxID=1385519 RepID=A0A0A0JLN3_9MICO|nr:hypothetical protein [Knoellia aerolata]KGN37998.1 hypothetical protein N801_00315 [Knoellia aerolata DSM 18566]